MRDLSENELAAILEGSTERRNLEFKPPFSWDASESQWLREKVIRAILGMTNTPGGGRVVVGVDEDAYKRPVLRGLTPGAVATFENFEKIKKTVDSFASLGTDFEITKGVFREGIYVLFIVRDFDRRPVICTSDGKTGRRDRGALGDTTSGTERSLVLRRGDIYCRSRRGEPKTDRITDAELEELLESWAIKRPILSIATPPMPSPSVEEQYVSRVKDLE